MADPFISEIRMFGFGWAPRGWAQCDGQQLPINQHQALYALLGTSFGGDGRTTVGLPDMRGRAPMQHGTYSGHEGTIVVNRGDRGGVENVTLNPNELATHTHNVRGTTANATSKQFSNTIFANGFDNVAKVETNMYGPATQLVSLNEKSVSYAGSTGAHSNIQPLQVVNFCISLTGTFPSRD